MPDPTYDVEPCERDTVDRHLRDESLPQLHHTIFQADIETLKCSW